MSGLLSGKVCLITGASRGIGREIATLFAHEGAVVYANDLHGEQIEAWAAELPEGECVKALPFDITSPEGAKQAIMELRKAEGRLDVLVNNAGVEYNEGIGMIQREHLMNMLMVNTVGTVEMLQLAARVMMRNTEGGSIINMASIVGLRGNPGQLGYAASKGAVVSVTRSAAKELARYKIRVNAIAPGLINTEMFKRVDPEKMKKRIDGIGLGYVGEPVEVAKACVFLASDLSSYISGQILGVDGCSVL